MSTYISFSEGTLIGKLSTTVELSGKVSGAYKINSQEKIVSSSFQEQIVYPDADYDYLSSVTISPITFEEIDNSAGGKTITIG